MTAALDLKQFENDAGVRQSIRRAQNLLRPPPDIKPSEWAERNVRIPEGNAKPGRLRFANAPYQVEPVDQLVNPDCYRVSLMWGAQVGKTLAALIMQGFSIELQPRSQMMMQPSRDDLLTWLETKFNPLVDSTPELKRRIAKPRGRDGVNNQKMKSYPGGFLMFAWSGSPKTMRGRSAPLIVCDEVDGYDATAEGHPVGLLWQRAATFGDDRMLVEISTPTVKDESYIEKAFEAGDQRRFHVCCPECGHLQTFKWENVNWKGRVSTGIDDAEKDMADMDAHEPASALYACEGCGVLLDDGQRVAAIRNAVRDGGGWIAAKPFKGHASYHLNEMYSTFRRLRDIVQSYLDKLATDDLQTFVNVSLSRTWEEKGEKADPASMQERAKLEVWRAQVPAGGVYLTAGVDMQMDRLEIEVVAWGEAEESWSVAYIVLWGDTTQPDVWEDLDTLWDETYLHESGAQLEVKAAVLDTGGTNGMTQAAYNYLKGKTGRRLFAGKGVPGWDVPVVQAPMRKQSGRVKRKVDLFNVGVDGAKAVVMRRWARVEPGPGYCHIPHDREEEWFKQATAEKLVTRYVKGQPVREWHKPDKARNEALDCRVYAYAALKIMNPPLKRLSERMRAQMPEKVPFKQIEPKAAQSREEWAKETANKAIRLRDALETLRETRAEKPPEEPKPQPKETAKVERPSKPAKRTAAKRKNFATTW
jgi:phage terminase large subunit GpA-like protein